MIRYSFRRLGLIAAAGCIAAVIALLGVTRPVDLWLVEKRMDLAPREAGGEVVFVGIDKRSLDAVGTWPWPREVHADIIRGLGDLGVAEIYFDIEFGTDSNADSDAALAHAIADSPVPVVLPVLAQDADVAADALRIEDSWPIKRLRDHAWLATVNVVRDTDGLIRSFLYGQKVGTEDLLSMPAMMAGVPGPVGSRFMIDFSILPDTVPAISAADVLAGTVDAGLLQGKRVIVGAHAIELGDNFAVPVHGVISGPMVQIIASETLEQGRALREIRPELPVLALFGVLAFLGIIPLFRGLRRALVVLGTGSVLVEVAAFAAQDAAGLVVPTAVLHLMIAGIALGMFIDTLRVLGWRLDFARIEGQVSQEVLRQVLRDSTDAVLVIDGTERVIDASGRAVELFGVASADREDALGSLVLPGRVTEAVRRGILRSRDGAPPEIDQFDLTFDVAGETRILECDVVPSVLPGAPGAKPVAGAGDCIVCVTARDVTDRRERDAAIVRMSRFDELTGAMRRAEFLLSLGRCPQDESGKAIAIFALKLRGFKTVNVTLGREVGDEVLKSIVCRIAACDPRLGAVARLGSDVFAVHSACCLDQDEAAEISRNLVAAIVAPYDANRSKARVGVHVGRAFHDNPLGREVDVALSSAEQALDEARKVFGDAVRSFDPGSSIHQEKSRRIERSLWSALEHDQFFVAYQPQVRLSDLRIIGAEALVRWRHPIMGFVSPGDFIEIAETSGFIADLGRWVLRKACEDAARWPDDIPVAVNVSPVQFQMGDMVSEARAALKDAGLAPEKLHLEITESLFVEGSGEVRETLADLRMMGIALALDDFGSGFSSFGYLANFPLDKVKADQMFVRKLRPGDKNHAILKSIRMLTRELDLKLICEGIETEEQMELLRDMGCEQGQGYLFGRPQSQKDLLDAIAAGAGGQKAAG